MIKPEAVLFDLDGVLCDTSEYIFGMETTG